MARHCCIHGVWIPAVVSVLWCVLYVLYITSGLDFVYSSVRVHRSYGSLEVAFIRGGISLARRVRTPPVWVEESSFSVFLQDDVMVFVGEG